MAFIYIQKKKFDEDGKIVDGIASIRESVYVKGKKHHSNQKTIEKLGRLLYISDDRKNGIFDSPIRGVVEYNVVNNEFSTVNKNDDRIKNKTISNIPKIHTTFGDAYLLLSFMEKEELLQIFRNIFKNNNDYERALSHITHDIMRDGSHITCDNFIEKSFMSYIIPDLGISSLKSDTRFFKFMGDDNTKLNFFKEYIKAMRKHYPNFGKATYVDSTPLPNDIVNNPFNALCSHGIGQTSVQMRLALILDQQTGLPVWFEIIAGNILDINTLKKLSENTLTSLDIQINDYVLDAGYVSKELISEFNIGKEKTIIARMPARKGFPYKELYNNVKDLFHKGKYQFKRKDYTYFGIKRNLEIFSFPMYEYIYLDHCAATKGFNSYLEKHQEESNNMKNKDKDFRMVKDGYFVLVSNKDDEPKKILEEYYNRTEIENVFKTSKEYLNLLPINKWNAESVKGKILTDIITTIIYITMRKKLTDKEISISNIIGSTQSLMCFKDINNIVTVECPNKNVKMCYSALNITIPNTIDINCFVKDVLKL